MAFLEERRRQVRKSESDAAVRVAKAGGSGGYRFGEEAATTAAVPLSLISVNAPHRVTVGDYTLVLPAPPANPPGLAYDYTKRFIDTVVAGIGLLVLMPFLVVVALAIYAEDRGEIFYYQQRVGRNGHVFRFYKFRSMVRNADAIKAQLMEQNEATGPIFKMKDDPRVTRVGRLLRRYSIDELPQLINVLRGEMSLIGPRPHLPREVALYTERQQARLSVQPGLLCFREVTGRSRMTFEQWMALDMIYIDYRSFRTDLYILLKTIPAILKGEGAY